MPLETPVSRLNQRRLWAAVRERLLSDSLQEVTDPAESAQISFVTLAGAWQIALVVASSEFSQLTIDIEVLIGPGPLSLARQLSLPGLFGIGGNNWDLTPVEKEAELADYLQEYCNFMVPFIRDLVTNLDPEISSEEVRRTVEDWKDWLTERRSSRSRRKPSQPR